MDEALCHAETRSRGGTRVYAKQLLTYLRLMKKRVVLLINFGGSTLMDGLHRVVNRLSAAASPRLRVNQSA
jgi:hypothetical protein